MNYLVCIVRKDNKVDFYNIKKPSSKEERLLNQYDNYPYYDKNFSKLFARFGYSDEHQDKKYYRKWVKYLVFYDFIEDFTGQLIRLHEG